MSLTNDEIKKLSLKERQDRKMGNTKLFIGYLRHKIKRNNNYITVFAGDTGSGKSYGALSLGDMLDDQFEVENICFTPLEFVKRVDYLIEQKRKGAVIIFDEAGTEGMSSRDWHSAGNKSINSLLQTFRSNNLILIITVPFASFIDSRARKLCDSIVQFNGSSVNRKDKISTARIQKIQASQYNDKILMPYPKLHTKQGILQLRSLSFPCPPRKLINAYEERKAQFNKLVRDAAARDMRPEGAEHEGVILTKIQKQVLDLYEGGKTLEEIGAIRGCTGVSVGEVKRAIEKKLRRKLIRPELPPPKGEKSSKGSLPAINIWGTKNSNRK